MHFIFSLLLERKEEERGRERNINMIEKHQHEKETLTGCPITGAPTRDQTHNPDMCPD